MKDVPERNEKRLRLYKYRELADLVVLLDHLFNQVIEDAGNNITTWIFIDSVDQLLSSEQTAHFLCDYVDKMNTLGNVLTMVIQSSVMLFTDSAIGFRLEDLINMVGYHKLLNQGAIERKKYTELLNISDTLVNYITSADLGKGVLFTAASNTAFDDNFYNDEDIDKSGFYELFKM